MPDHVRMIPRRLAGRRAVDHVRDGIRVNCIASGTMDTPWVQRITSGYGDPEAARPGDGGAPASRPAGVA